MAEINPSKTIIVTYDMYTVLDGVKELVEQATAEHPFQFTTGLGFTFEAFEEKFNDLKEGDTFNFTLTKDETNGDRNEEYVMMWTRTSSASMASLTTSRSIPAT